MYFSYGWPKTLGLLDDEYEVLVDLQADRHDERIIILTTTTIQVWSAGKQRVKLGEIIRDEESLAQHGSNKQCLVQEKRGQLVVLTSQSWLLFFKLQEGGPLFLGFDVKNQPTGLNLIRLSSSHQCRVVCSKQEATCNCLAGDADVILLGLENGYIVQYSWDGKLEG
eukprot:CAMPEP_0118947194 /NCGR_PEP_ID=MMETSP1169-20130426/45573_1 /TAXON_ID=36882 /ORGANISM="Pyramimonas obovata, Strain CCMP722" /LENGTH=166 /DNA_ID=CAMNT_0006893361 /DNA_START=138 /DNA_END=634 /DNA_ORIENTATION=-